MDTDYFDEAQLDAVRDEAFFEAADIADQGFPDPPEPETDECIGCRDTIPAGARVCGECLG